MPARASVRACGWLRDAPELGGAVVERARSPAEHVEDVVRLCRHIVDAVQDTIPAPTHARWHCLLRQASGVACIMCGTRRRSPPRQQAGGGCRVDPMRVLMPLRIYDNAGLHVWGIYPLPCPAVARLPPGSADGKWCSRRPFRKRLTVLPLLATTMTRLPSGRGRT